LTMLSEKSLDKQEMIVIYFLLILYKEWTFI